jgi:hypothetical protein
MCAAWEGKYILRNDSEIPWAVRGISTSCGCFQVSAPIEAVMPGEEITVDLAFNLKDRFGRVDESAQLTLADPEQGLQDARVVTIHISGEVLPEVVWEPPVLTAPNLVSGEIRTLAVIAKLRQPGQFLLAHAKVSPPIGIAREVDHTKVVVTLHEADLPKGTPSGTLEIPFRLTRTPDIQPILRVQWARRSPFIAIPAFLQAKWIREEDPFILPSLSIRREDGRSFRIQKVEVPGAWLRVRFGQAASETQALSFDVDPSLKVFPRCILTVMTDDPWLPGLKIPLIPE